MLCGGVGMSTVWHWPGARWWKFDFHTHTPASRDTPWYRLIGTADELTPEDWLRRYMDAGIDCVAITDHNTGAWIDRLKDAYERMMDENVPGFRSLHLFPGVEISVNGGFHLLAIFNDTITTSDIDTLLGKVDYDGTKGDSDGVTRKSPVQVIHAVLDAGGLAIPAHVDQKKGLLQVQELNRNRAVLDPNTLKQVLECARILAAEVVDRGRLKPTIYTESGVAWSEVLGSDCENFRGPHPPGSRFTWIKMATPTLEGLRLALLDGEGFSIHRCDDPKPFDPFALPENFVESVEICEARYMGRGRPQKLLFSPWFNALIGGRGTGKSTVLHCLRLAYRREQELDALGANSEVRRAFQAFNRVPSNREDVGGLQAKTTVTVTLIRDGVRHRLHWGQDGQGVAVEEESNGHWYPSHSQHITPDRFPLRIFSQGQIVELAGENQQALLGVIDEGANVVPEKEEIEHARQKFLALRAQIRELQGRLQKRSQLSVQLQDVQRKLARFEAVSYAEVLKMYQLRTRQETELDEHFKAVESIADQIAELVHKVIPRTLPDGLFNRRLTEDQEAISSVQRLAQWVSETAGKLGTAAEELRQNTERERESLHRTTWYAAISHAKSRYQELMQSLKVQGASDASEYSNLVEEQRRLEAELSNLSGLEAQCQDLIQQTEQTLTRLKRARHALSKKRADFLSSVLVNNLFVKIRLLPFRCDARTIERSLREVLGVVDDRFEDDILVVQGGRPTKGLVFELLRDPGQEERNLDILKERIEAACRSEATFGGYFNNYLKRAFEKKPEFLDRILTWFPEDGLEVEYSPEGDGQDFRSIGQASAGQRAAAMLAFLLAHGTEPILLDQPEDDLDNHLIYDLVVRQIRANKTKRQIIVVTHNPNIVVNGDAEMLHALDARNGECLVVESGSLQKLAVREEVCRVMEGGRDAFESRYRRLGRDPGV